MYIRPTMQLFGDGSGKKLKNSAKGQKKTDFDTENPDASLWKKLWKL